MPSDWLVYYSVEEDHIPQNTILLINGVAWTDRSVTERKVNKYY